MVQDRPFLGILLIVGFCAIAPLGDSIAKLLGDTISLGQLLFVRFAIQFFILVPFVFFQHLVWRLQPDLLRLAILRTLLHVIGIGAMFASLRFLPLADAIAIAFIMPFILLLLSWRFLGDNIGPRRVVACLVGFIGALLVIQPSFIDVGLPALLPLVVAVAFAVFMLVTRQLAQKTDPIGLQMVSGGIAMLVLIPFVLIGTKFELPGLQITAPSRQVCGLLLAIGILGTVAHLLMTWALRFAPAATLAPVQYLEIPFGTVIGFLIFNDIPGAMAAVGITLTIAAGLYIIVNERANSRATKAAHQPPN